MGFVNLLEPLLAARVVSFFKFGIVMVGGLNFKLL
jgi:hypothetical protein